MDGASTARQSSATGGITRGTKRRRIRPSRARGLRTRTGCLTCRERRVKCDDGKPTCLRCSKSHRICLYASVGHATDPEPPGAQPSPQEQQPSLDAPYFEDTGPAPAEAPVALHANEAIETSQSDQRLPGLDSGLSNSPLSLSQVSLLNISPLEWYDLLARDAISNIQRRNDAPTGDPRWKFPDLALSRRQSPAPGLEDHYELAERRPEQQQQVQDDTIEASLVGHPQVLEPWNTANRIELSAVDFEFFQYYIEVVGPILDLFDPDRHFINIVPHLALRNTGLLKSILAVGAKHKSLGLIHISNEDTSGHHAASQVNTPSSLAAASAATTGQPSESNPTPAHMATHYYYETLQYLSQTLLYPSYADSREILATATMISTYEMFDIDSASTSGDWEKHLRGSFWIQRSQDNDGESVDGLRRAVWWAWLRQDIWAAFRAGRPTLSFWRARKPLEDLDPDGLATRIVYICGQCVAYAASDEATDRDPRPRIGHGDRLLRALDDWYRVLPASYQPVTISEGGSQATFPSIWIHPPSHAGAMQMYSFARAIVLLNQPTRGGLNAYRQREKELTDSVKMVCGIASACGDHDSAMAFVNVQALFGVGQFVRSQEMRSELLRILEKMLRISKFPARGLVGELNSLWQE
ncbi:Zn(II)2Cys6 transcription factor [Aspergillus affinis]|uniref:Zn(II)2Cys6 transcription factor n=1 Tax=Aspergillus affinis TaxID=1070780 RepID=UPI0022FE9482|nr:Zn(II)2Cys6 transcription factor [Aspergillus affinis]KAI9040021.1 Zn(II)2Cys6 transcription factor [Aspergillus affinis]